MSPKSQERRFAPEYADTLLNIAREDYRSACYAVDGVITGQFRAENAFFLFQQAVEKLLKAVLCRLGLPVPMVHDLGVLLAKLPPHTQPDVGYEIAALNDFAGVRRYEEGRMVYEPEDLEDVRAMTDELLTWAEAVRAR